MFCYIRVHCGPPIAVPSFVKTAFEGVMTTMNDECAERFWHYQLIAKGVSPTKVSGNIGPAEQAFMNEECAHARFGLLVRSTRLCGIVEVVKMLTEFFLVIEQLGRVDHT